MQKIIDKYIGKQIRDKVSGLEGICVSITYFLNGCIRLSVQQKVDKDGKLLEEKWFDQAQIEIVEDENKTGVVPSNTGGPQSSSTPQMR